MGGRLIKKSNKSEWLMYVIEIYYSRISVFFFKLIGRKLKTVKESWGRKQLPIATVKINRHTEAMLKFENE